MTVKNVANIRCKKHPRYQGIRFPKAECYGCVLTWVNRNFPLMTQVNKELADQYVTYVEVADEDIADGSC